MTQTIDADDGTTSKHPMKQTTKQNWATVEQGGRLNLSYDEREPAPLAAPPRREHATDWRNSVSDWIKHDLSYDFIL